MKNNNNLPNSVQILEFMNVIEITKAGDPSVLKPATRAVPALKSGEILIEVHYAGVNRPDCLQRQGLYNPPPTASDLPGLEVSGLVVATNSRKFKQGDKVTALTAGGGYAQYVAVAASNALPIPEGLTLLEAAALPETYFTVWVNLFMRGKLKAGETLLVHGGTSGIGTTAIQLAKAFGATVYTTAGSEEKCRTCEKLGATKAFNYKTEDWVSALKTLTLGKGVNVILDMVGGDYVAKNYEVASDKGRIIQIAFLQGAKVELDLRPVMMKRLTHTGSTLRPRTDEEKGAIANQLKKYVWEKLTKGEVKPIIDTVLPLKDAANAHELMEASNHIGKIMLKVKE